MSASAIHGTLISAGLIGAGSVSHGEEHSIVEIAVVTLVVFWLSFSYCEIVEHQVRSRDALSARDVLHALRDQLAILVAGAIPLAVFIVADLGRHTSTRQAGRIALLTAMFELVLAGASAAYAAGHRGLWLAGYALACGSLGLVLVAAEMSIAH